jgi:hypothetical protein
MQKSFQPVPISSSCLPNSKISRFSSVTLTCFDGFVHLLGKEIPLYSQAQYFFTPIYSSVIGSCSISIEPRIDFLICGSTVGRVYIWNENSPLYTIGGS